MGAVAINESALADNSQNGVKKMEPLKIGMQDIAALTCESIPTIYKAIELGHLETFLVGRRRFARPEAVRRWVDYLQSESNAGRPICYQARNAKSAAPAD